MQTKNGYKIIINTHMIYIHGSQFSAMERFPVGAPQNFLTHYIGGRRHMFYSGNTKNLIFERLINRLEYRIRNGLGSIQHDRPVDIHAQILFSHELNLAVNDDRTGNQQDGSGKLANYQTLS